MNDFDNFNRLLIYANNVLHRNITNENVVQSLMEVRYNKYINPVKLNDEKLLDYNNYEKYHLDRNHDFFEIKAYEECRSDWSQKDLEDLKQGKDVLILVDFNTGNVFDVKYKDGHKYIGKPINVSFRASRDLDAIMYYYQHNKYEIENTFNHYNSIIWQDNFYYKKLRDANKPDSFYI